VTQPSYRASKAASLSYNVALSRIVALGALTSAPLFACAAIEEPEAASHGTHALEFESVQSALVSSDPVSMAVAQECSTYSVRALSLQLIAELQCLKPGAIKSIEGIAGISLGEAVFPYLQTPAANAVIAAQKSRGKTLVVNSALRSLAQQFLLYRWYELGRCGIPLAAVPGRSNHESALALDIEDNQGWRSSLSDRQFRWLGANDEVHYDYVGANVIDIRGASVEAFQRLWNRNHPEDRIDEDGVYGPGTAARIEKSPVGGFKIGATCNKTAEPSPAGGRPAPSQPPTPAAPGSELPASSASPSSAAGASSAGASQAGAEAIPDARESAAPVSELSGGCTIAPGQGVASSLSTLVCVCLVVACSRARKRKRRACV
jgi:D-alanyl-D-alanine carboxypeptidase